MAKTAGKELTPMMKQFFDLKAKHPDAVMLFRCGDFYETYCEDAITASKILGMSVCNPMDCSAPGSSIHGIF